MLTVAGVTVIFVTVFAATVSDAVPLIVPTEAVIVVVPAATPVASPPALMVAVAVLELIQLAVVVMFFVEPSL